MTSYLPATDANTDRTRSALSFQATFSKPKSILRPELSMTPLECIGPIVADRGGSKGFA